MYFIIYTHLYIRICIKLEIEIVAIHSLSKINFDYKTYRNHYLIVIA